MKVLCIRRGTLTWNRQHLNIEARKILKQNDTTECPHDDQEAPGARMLETLARVGLSWEVEVRENSRHSLMVTRAGRRPPSRRRGCSTPSLEVTHSALTPAHTLPPEQVTLRQHPGSAGHPDHQSGGGDLLQLSDEAQGGQLGVVHILGHLIIAL